LRLFWEGHDPTQRREPPHGSLVYCASESQRRAAERSRDVYRSALAAAGQGMIVTEIVDAAEMHIAEEGQQQYLAKNSGGYSGSGGTGVGYPR